MAAGSIVIDLLMKTGSFVTDTDRASKRLKQFQKEAKEAGTAIGAAVAAGITATAVLLKSSIDTMDDISKAAQRAGTTTEEFSKLAYGAGLADVAVTDLQTSLGRLTKAQAEALDPATQQAKVFKALGIEVTDAAGNLRSSTDVFKDFADVFEEQKGSPEIIAAGLNIFGRSFQNLIPLLKDGSAGLKDAAAEAQAFGQVISTEAGANAEEFNDNLSRMKLFVTGVANAVAADLLPDLVGLQDGFLDGARDGDKLHQIAEDVANVFRVLAGAIELAMIPIRRIDNVIQGTTAGLQGLMEAAKGVIGLNWDQVTRGLSLSVDAALLAQFGDPLENEKGSKKPRKRIVSPGELTDPQAAADQKAADALRAQAERAKRIRELAFGPEEKAEKSKPAGKSEAEKEADRLADAYKGVNDQLEEQIALNGNTSAAAKLAFDLQTGELSKLSAAEKEHLTVLQSKADLQELERAALQRVNEESENYARAVQEQENAFKAHAADLQFEIDLLSMSNKERNREVELRYLAADATDKQREEIAKLADERYEDTLAMQKSIALQDDFRDGFGEAFSEIITGSKSAKDALLDFLDSINQRLAQRIGSNIADSLFGEQGQTGGGSYGGILSEVAGWFGGVKATGGDVLDGRSYLVGEEGPELFTPRTAGRILPADVTAAQRGMGTADRPLVITNNMTIQGKVDRRSAQQVARETALYARMAIARNG